MCFLSVVMILVYGAGAMIPASICMGSYYRSVASLYTHFAVEVTHNYVVVGFSSELEGPRYVIEHILCFIV